MENDRIIIKTEIDEYELILNWQAEFIQGSGKLTVYMNHQTYVENNFKNKIERAIL